MYDHVQDYFLTRKGHFRDSNFSSEQYCLIVDVLGALKIDLTEDSFLLQAD